MQNFRVREREKVSKASKLQDGEKNEVYWTGVCFPTVAFPSIPDVAQFHGTASLL